MPTTMTAVAGREGVQLYVVVVICSVYTHCMSVPGKVRIVLQIETHNNYTQIRVINY